jgi:hypothetical protein
MAYFRFELDQKITKWVRTQLHIEADTLEEAKQIAIKQHLDLETTELPYEDIEGSEEFIFPHENDNQSTEELARDGVTFWTNVNYNIFLDDKRSPPNLNYLLVINYDDFVHCIKTNGLPKFISFDHDLGDINSEQEKTGYDCAVWLVNYCMDNGLELPNYYVHSQNPIGKEKINALFKNYIKQLE